MGRSSHDVSNYPTLIAADSTLGTSIVELWANSTTHGLLIENTEDVMLGTDFSNVFGTASLVSAAPAVKVEEQGTVTVDTELPAAVALGDAVANPTTPLVGAALMGWDSAASAWERILTNASGVLQVIDAATLVDDAAFTPAATRIYPVGATFDDTSPDSVDEGDAGILRMSANRNLYTTIRDAAGNERGLNVAAIDSAVGATDTGFALLAKHNSDVAHLTTAEGDYDVLQMANFGGLQVAPEQHHILDSMNATTGWAALGNDTLNLATTKKHVLGTDALTFDKVDGAANTVFAGIAKTITSVDLGNPSPHDLIQTACYLPTLTDVSYVFVRLGTDSSNYNEWRIEDTALTAATLETLLFNVGGANYAGITGNGWDPSAVTYVAIGVAFDAETDALAGIVFDEISFHTNIHTSAELNAEVSSSVSSANVNLQKVGGSATDKGAGNASNGSQRVVLATDDVNAAAIKTAVELLDDTVYVDDANWSDSSSKHLLVGGLYQSSPQTITDGDVAPFNITVNGAIHTSLQTALPTGSNAIGKLATNSGVDIGDVDVTSIAAGTNVIGKVRMVTATGDEVTEDTDNSMNVTIVADDVGIGGGTQYAEDAAHASGHTGTMALIVRDDALAANAGTSADLDYMPARGDNFGALWVTLTDAAGGGVDASSIGGGTQQVYDAAADWVAAGADTITPGASVRDDALSALTPAEGDYVPTFVNSVGALWVEPYQIASGAIKSGAVASGAIASGAVASGAVASGAFASGSISAGAVAAGATSFVALEDDASANADAGVKIMARRTATPADTSGADLDYEMLQMDNGRLWASATIDAALPAGTNAIGKLAANSGVDIGDVDVTSITGVTMSNAAIQTTGDEAHDAADAGNPVKFGGRAQTSEAQPDEVADNDRVDALFDRSGYLRVRGDFDPSFADINDAVSGNNTIIAAQAAGKRIAVWAILMVSDGTVDARWEDGAGGTAFTGQIPLQAREGYSISAGGLVPLFVGSAATLLNLELSAAINVHGFVSYTVIDD